MKQILNSILFILFLSFFQTSFSQILDVKETIQEQDQWCWAGVSACILDFYGETTEQCEIAEYARTVITWHDFGSVNCCDDPSKGCNYWNYNYGNDGSIKDILTHFAEISNYGQASSLSTAEITQNLSEDKPFVIRWGWTSGGGHFLVGHGIKDNTIYYMDPWFGEGLKFAAYDWVINDGSHDWTHTNVLTTPAVLGIKNNTFNQNIIAYPNPANNFIYIQNIQSNTAKIEIINLQGQIIVNEMISKADNRINIQNLSKGIYILKVNELNNHSVQKIIVQ